MNTHPSHTTTHLDETERFLENGFDGKDLRVVELRQVGGAEATRVLHLDARLFNLVTQQLVVQVTRHCPLVHSKRSHGRMHSAVSEVVECMYRRI